MRDVLPSTPPAASAAVPARGSQSRIPPHWPARCPNSPAKHTFRFNKIPRLQIHPYVYVYIAMHYVRVHTYADVYTMPLHPAVNTEHLRTGVGLPQAGALPPNHSVCPLL